MYWLGQLVWYCLGMVWVQTIPRSGGLGLGFRVCACEYVCMAPKQPLLFYSHYFPFQSINRDAYMWRTTCAVMCVLAVLPVLYMCIYLCTYVCI